MAEGNVNGRWVSLSVLTGVFTVGELCHFLPGIVTRPMAQEIHYGTQECLVNPESDFDASEGINCYNATNRASCKSMGPHTPGANGSSHSPCVWDYSGLGLEYQILAGPAFIAIFTVSGILLGFVADRFNRKIVVLLCLAFMTLSSALTGFATMYWHLVVLRMGVAAGESVFSPACSSMISDMFSEARRGVALGIFNWGIYFGYGLSYAVGNFLTQADILGMGWRWSYFVTGALGGVVVIFMIFAVREPERKTHAEEPPTSEGPKGKAGDPHADSEKDRSFMENFVYGQGGLLEIAKAMLSPPVLMLTLAACVRHTAGFSWAYNTQLYFTTYYPRYNLGIWITAISIIGGAMGVVSGGFVSDKFVKKIGLRARVYVLAASQLIATPFAVGVLYFRPPVAFYILILSYMFAEMWFGVMFAVLLELIPARIHSSSIAIFLFLINNVGGNAPVLVEPLRSATSYYTALLIMYPGLYLASSVLFFITSFLIPLKSTSD